MRSPGRATSAIGLTPHSGAKGKKSGALATASTYRPGTGGSTENRPSASDVTESAPPSQSNVTVAPATGSPVDQFMTRPLKAPLASAGSCTTLAAPACTSDNVDVGVDVVVLVVIVVVVVDGDVDVDATVDVAVDVDGPSLPRTPTTITTASTSNTTATSATPIFCIRVMSQIPPARPRPPSSAEPEAVIASGASPLCHAFRS